MSTAFLRQLPRYQSHKQVSALKIKAVIQNPRGFELHFVDERFAPQEVPAAWVEKHNPEPTGYLVVYEDGYLSWSPAGAFESGYTLVETADGAVRSLDFGDAIRALKAGKRVARAGWNGKGMWLSLINGQSVQLHGKGFGPVNEHDHDWRERVPRLLDWIGMKTADNGFVPWLASQTDMLATDWVVL